MFKSTILLSAILMARSEILIPQATETECIIDFPLIFGASDTGGDSNGWDSSYFQTTIDKMAYSHTNEIIATLGKTNIDGLKNTGDDGSYRIMLSIIND